MQAYTENCLIYKVFQKWYGTTLVDTETTIIYKVTQHSHDTGT